MFRVRNLPSWQLPYWLQWFEQGRMHAVRYRLVQGWRGRLEHEVLGLRYRHLPDWFREEQLRCLPDLCCGLVALWLWQQLAWVVPKVHSRPVQG